MSGSFEDPSDWKAYAEAFELIADWNDELFAVETVRKLFGTVIDIALEDLRLSTVTIYCFDEETAEGLIDGHEGRTARLREGQVHRRVPNAGLVADTV